MMNILGAGIVVAIIVYILANIPPGGGWKDGFA